MAFLFPYFAFLFVVFIFVIDPVAHSLPFIVLHGNHLLFSSKVFAFFFYLIFFTYLFEYLALFSFWMCGFSQIKADYGILWNLVCLSVESIVVLLCSLLLK
jgi:hypothetical protein